MKIKCYDKYHKQWLYIEPQDDEMWDWKSSGPSGVQIQVYLMFSAVEGDNDSCDPKRWSDLEQFSFVE
jgi:hypothetical protein